MSGRELWRRKGFHTLGSPFTGGECGWQRGEASEPWRRAQPQGCGGQSGEIPAQRLGAEKHSQAREACLLTRWGGRGLGAEGRASVGSQGEDWGWRSEHSLKGLAHHSKPGGSLGKRLQLPKRQETVSCLFVSRCARRGDSECHLHELQRRARAAAISTDHRDGHETLRLLLPPRRTLCASTGHYPHRPSWEPVQPTTAKLLWSRDNFPRRTHGAPHAAATSRLRLLQRHAGLCRRRLAPHPYPSLPPAWVSQSPRSSCSFNPVLCERKTDGLKRPTRRGWSKSKAEPRELYEQRREREISPSSLRSSGLKLHKQLDIPASVEYLNRQWIIPNSGGGLWEQDILIFPRFLFLWVYMCMFLGEILSV